MRSSELARAGGRAGLEVAGHHPAGEQQRDADALIGQLGSQGLAVARDRELAGLVRRQPDRWCEHARGRGEHDPPPAGALAEHGEERTDGAHGAEDVHVEHPLPVLVGQGIDRAELLHTDVRAEDVAAAERGSHVLGACRHRCGITHIDPG
jgi:hypothetical protein